MSALLRFTNISMGFGGKAVLKDVNLEINSGEHTLILGPSGAGKTTLLHLAGALIDPQEGRRIFESSHYPKSAKSKSFRRENIGFLFQDFHLVEHLSVEDNIGLYQAALGAPSNAPSPTELLTPLGLSDRMTEKVSALSRGERQRVALARAFAHAPKLVVADEPTASLDPARAESTLQFMWELCEQLGTTALIVSHDRSLQANPRLHACYHLVDGQLRTNPTP
jgi:ABC-type lipoprotein export system ATPase subunit